MGFHLWARVIQGLFGSSGAQGLVSNTVFLIKSNFKGNNLIFELIKDKAIVLLRQTHFKESIIYPALHIYVQVLF